MKSLTRAAVVAALAVWACLGIGCKRSGEDPTVMEGVSKLPGASNVMAAIDKKDYEGAMAALNQVKESVTNEEQTREFMVLARQARDKMGEAAATDPKAAEAVNALRSLTTGGR